MATRSRDGLVFLLALSVFPAAESAAQAGPACDSMRITNPDDVVLPATCDAACFQAVANCFQTLGDRNQIDELDTAGLLGWYREYKRLAKWNRRLATRTDPGAQFDRSIAGKAQERAGRAIHSRMAEAGLREPFFGALVSGPVFQTVAKKPDESNPGTAASGTVFFESKHLGASSDTLVHASVGGRVGYDPVFLMDVPKDASPETPAAPSYSSGLVWDLGLNIGVPLGRISAGEATLFGRYGQSRPGAAELVDEKQPTARIAVPSDVAGGLAKDYWVVGVKAVVFRTELAADSAHERGYLLPAASLQFGMRWDKRFRNDSRLAAYASPEQRLFFGFRLNALRVFTDAGDKEDGTYELTFGVEREWALRRGGLPSGTKIVLAGTVNLLKALGGSSSTAKPAKTEEAKAKEARARRTPGGWKGDDGPTQWSSARGEWR